jgi:hypothetical protein
VCAVLVLDDEWAVTATTGGARWCASSARNDILATSMLDCVVDAPAAAGRAAVKSRIVAARRQRASIRRCGVPMRRRGRGGGFVVTQPLQRSSPSEMEAAFATAREPRGVLASTPDRRATLDAMERVFEALAAFDLERLWRARDIEGTSATAVTVRPTRPGAATVCCGSAISSHHWHECAINPPGSRGAPRRASRWRPMVTDVMGKPRFNES